MKKGFIITFIGCAFWGISGTIGQYLFTNYNTNTLWLSVIRMFFAGIILITVAFFKDQDNLKLILQDKRDVGELIIFAILGLMFCQYSYMTAIYYSNSSTAAILQFLNPIFIMIFTCIVSKRLPYKKEALCVLLALSGVFILATHGNINEVVITTQGLFWGVMAGFSATLYSLLPRRLINRRGSLVVSGYGMLIGGIFLGIVGRVWEIPVQLDLIGWLCIIAIVLIGTVGGFTLYLTGITLIGPIKASLIGAVEPLSATLCMCLWLHSPFTFMDMLGFALILSTLFILTLNKQAK